VKSTVSKPQFGWGSVSSGDVGTLKSISGTSCRVNFDAQSGWTGVLAELERVKQTTTTKISATTGSRPNVGDLVCLAKGLTQVKNLSAGDVGKLLRDDQSSLPFKVENVADGTTRWFKADQIVRHIPSPSSAPSTATSSSPTRRPAVGDKVKLSSSYRSCSDAASGPLNPGDIGTVIKDDKGGKPFNVKSSGGSTWWYKAGALVIASDGSTATSTAAAAAGLSPVYVTDSNKKVGRRVQRGPDWKWGDQDKKSQGGYGVISSLDSSGWVKVKWEHGSTNAYRTDQRDLQFC
jgi:hypothetical protein